MVERWNNAAVQIVETVKTVEVVVKSIKRERMEEAYSSLQEIIRQDHPPVASNLTS